MIKLKNWWKRFTYVEPSTQITTKEIKKEKEPDWVIRHTAKAKVFAETHKAGTRVIAESKDKTWKEGEIIGEHDWALFSFFFIVKFDDGEIIKQEERKVSKIRQ